MNFKNYFKKTFSVMLLFVLVYSISSNSFIYAENTTQNEKIDLLVKKALEEKSVNGEAKDITINELKKELENIGVNNDSYGGTHTLDNSDNDLTFFGYGETHSLGKGWTYRVDRPGHGASDAKPHVHVDNKNLGIHDAESVDGSPSHKKTLKHVPKNIKEKVRSSKDYKKGQSDLKKMKQAKSEIQKRHLNLHHAKDLVIAAGIFVSIVGVAFFAPEFLPVALAAI